QGMNTGIQDANNLSWKIAMVIRGQANAKLLDSYSEERVPVAKKIIRATFLPLRIITSQHFILRNLRIYLLPKLAKLVLPLLNYPVITQLLFKGISQIGYSYRMTNRSTQFFSQKFYKPAPKPGDRLPFVLFKETGETSNIQDKVTETCFCLLIFSKNPKSLIDMDRFVKKYKKILTVETIQYNLGTALLYKRFGIKREGYFIVRPDLHIAIRSSTVNIESFETALRIVRCM